MDPTTSRSTRLTAALGMSAVDIALGNERLLQLAEILDTADERHRERGEPTYRQWYFDHQCGTPACAAGHWAAANRDRWEFPEMHLREGSTGGIALDLMQEFYLDSYEFDLLFEGGGCDSAKTAKEAAAYIRAFVARRQS